MAGIPKPRASFSLHIRNSFSSPSATIIPSNVKDNVYLQRVPMNSRVVLSHRRLGCVRFIGKLSDTGEWYGIELDEAKGENDGTYDGVRYFSCAPQHGVFVRRKDIFYVKERVRSETGSDDDQEVIDVASTERPISPLERTYMSFRRSSSYTSNSNGTPTTSIPSPAKGLKSVSKNGIPSSPSNRSNIIAKTTVGSDVEVSLETNGTISTPSPPKCLKSVPLTKGAKSVPKSGISIPPSTRLNKEENSTNENENGQVEDSMETNEKSTTTSENETSCATDLISLDETTDCTLLLPPLPILLGETSPTKIPAPRDRRLSSTEQSTSQSSDAARIVELEREVDSLKTTHRNVVSALRAANNQHAANTLELRAQVTALTDGNNWLQNQLSTKVAALATLRQSERDREIAMNVDIVIKDQRIYELEKEINQLNEKMAKMTCEQEMLLKNVEDEYRAKHLRDERRIERLRQELLAMVSYMCYIPVMV